MKGNLTLKALTDPNKVLNDLVITSRINTDELDQKHAVAADDQPTMSRAPMFDAILRSRRSAHAFTNRPVDECTMEAILHAATLAPSSFNLQPYEFYWVRTPEHRGRLANLCLGQRPAVTAQELVVCVARWDHWRATSIEYMTWLKSHPGVTRKTVAYHAREHQLLPMMFATGPFNVLGRLRALMVAAIGLTRPILRVPASPDELTTWATKSAALACQNLILAARAHDLDTCPLEGFDRVRVGKLLGLKGRWSIPMIIAIGYRDKSGIYEPQWRRAPEQLIHVV